MNLETYNGLNHGNMVKSGTLIGHVVGKVDNKILIREKNNRTAKIYSIPYQSVTIWGPQIGGPSGYPGQPEDPVLAVPMNMALPTLTGTVRVGQTLTCVDGTWLGEPTPSFSRQWLRNGAAISGATGQTYALVAADYNTKISVKVTALNSQGSAEATSAQTANVLGNAPVNTAVPTVTGTAQTGQTLTSTNGTWTGTPTPTYTRKWQRGTTDIAGATAATYVVQAADEGSTIRCVVTATNAVGNASANSANTAVVIAA